MDKHEAVPTHDQLLILGTWGVHEQWIDVFDDMVRDGTNDPELLAYYYPGPGPSPQGNYRDALIEELYHVCNLEIEKKGFGTSKEIRGWINSDDGTETVQQRMKERIGRLPHLTRVTALQAKEFASSGGNAFPFLTMAESPYRMGDYGEYHLDQATPTLMVGDPESQLRFLQSVMAGIHTGLKEYPKSMLDVVQIGTPDALTAINPYHILKQSDRGERAYTFDQVNDEQAILTIGTQISSQVRSRINQEWVGAAHMIVVVHQVEKSLYMSGVLPNLFDARAKGFHVFATVDPSAFTPHLATKFGKFGQVFVGSGADLKIVASRMGRSHISSDGKIFPSQVIHVGTDMGERYWMLGK